MVPDTWVTLPPFFEEEWMPWKECSVMDERLQLVARRLAGEQMADLCREFGISRKTGYKIFDRYQECGVQGLTDRSRRRASTKVCPTSTIRSTTEPLWLRIAVASVWA